MSLELLLDTIAFHREALKCTPDALARLCFQRWERHLMSLPLHWTFECLRCPLQNLHNMEDVLSIPDDNVFFIDVLRDQLIFSADELRRWCYDNLRMQPKCLTPTRPALIWFVLNASNQACHGALVLHRTKTGYALERLWVSQHQLLSKPLVSETLLRLVCLMADRRQRELQVLGPAPSLAVTAFTLGVLGFMEDQGHLTRLCMPYAMKSDSVSRAVIRQIVYLLHIHPGIGRDSKTPAPPPDTPESTETPAGSKTV